MPKWPWRRHHEPAITEGTLARVEAEQNLRHHKSQRIEVANVAGSLRALRLRNHFSEQIQEMIQEGPQR